MSFEIIHQPLVGERRLDNPQPYRWRVTNDAAVPEPLAHGGESYTEERGALHGAEATLRQLLRAEQLDVPTIVSEWFIEMDEIEQTTVSYPSSLLVVGQDVDAEAALEISEFFTAWRKRHGLSDDTSGPDEQSDDTAHDGAPL